jgi:hypothetical protein
MYFSADNELNGETVACLEQLAAELLYGARGEMEKSTGIWITHDMLYADASAATVESENEADTSLAAMDSGFEVSHIESVEDFLNSGNANSRWQKFESITRTIQTDWIRDTLKEIINGKHDIDGEVRKYIISIVDQNKLVSFIDTQLEERGTTRKDWMESFLNQAVMPIIMAYQDVASTQASKDQQKRAEQQELMNKAEQASERVRKACNRYGELAKRYTIDDCDVILDMLEYVAQEADISENDIANFVLLNAPRFDEDVRYLLTTRFPVAQPGE